MNTCETCKHWAVPSGRPWGLCSRGKSRDGLQEDPDTLAWAESWLDDPADLLTRPDFGCVMHEAKEEGDSHV